MNYSQGHFLNEGQVKGNQLIQVTDQSGRECKFIFQGTEQEAMNTNYWKFNMEGQFCYPATKEEYLKHTAYNTTVKTHVLVDLDGEEFGEEFISKCKGIADYRDQILKEHMYGESTLQDKSDDEPDFFTEEEKILVQRIKDVMDIHGAAYFRFIFK